MHQRDEPVNPYASPLAEPDETSRQGVSTKPLDEQVVAPCPRCSGTNAVPAPYDWWRGRRGPRAIDEMVCTDCECRFHGETGVEYPPAKSPMPYFIVAVVLFALYVVVYIGFNLLLILR